MARMQHAPMGEVGKGGNMGMERGGSSDLQLGTTRAPHSRWRSRIEKSTIPPMKPSGVNSQRNGLTLVEVLVLLAIFLVLLAAMLPSFATQ